MKKLLKYLALMILVLPVFTINGMASEAAETDNVTVMLHKIVFPNGEMPDEVANTGDLSGTHADLLQEYRGLNDVTFEAYDVSNEFYALRKAGKTVEEAQVEVSKLDTADLTSALATEVTATVDGEDGVASFTLPTQDSEGRDAVYLFHESAAPAVVEQKANNMVVVLPVYTEDDTELSTIHLYPKNEEVEHGEPAFDKKIVDDQGSYQFGDVISFETTVEIPLDILDYQKFVITDAADPALVYQEGSLKLSANGTEIPKMYELSTNKNGFEVNFNDIKALDDYAGKVITLSYQMQLVTAESDVDVFVNEATLETDHEVIKRDVDVKTGGRHFVKVDLDDTDVTLAGAQFYVLNGQGEKLATIENGYTWTADDQADNLVLLESDDEGRFTLNGLAFGDYQLEEVTAPTGYQLSQEPVAFTVTEDSFTAGDAGILKVVNLKMPESVISTPKHSVPTTKVSKTTKVKSYPKTNEVIHRSMVGVGAILIAVVAVIYWQTRKKNIGE